MISKIKEARFNNMDLDKALSELEDWQYEQDKICLCCGEYSHNLSYHIRYSHCNLIEYNEYFGTNLFLSESDNPLERCQICGKDFESVGHHLRVHSEITQEDYYNTYIDGSRVSRNCECDGCINEVKFINLSSGYSMYCSHECRDTSPSDNQISNARNLLTNLHKDSKFKELHSSRMSTLYYELNGDINFRSNRAKLQFLSRFPNLDKAYIYFIKYNESTKIGITTDISKRLYSLGAKYYKYWESTPNRVAQLECDIKIKFNNFITENSIEHFQLDKYDEILKYIEDNINIK